MTLITYCKFLTGSVEDAIGDEIPQPPLPAGQSDVIKLCSKERRRAIPDGRIPLMKKPEYGYQGMIPMSDYVAIFKEQRRTEAIVYNSKTGKTRFSKINVPKNNKLVALQVYGIG